MGAIDPIQINLDYCICLNIEANNPGSISPRAQLSDTTRSRVQSSWGAIQVGIKYSPVLPGAPLNLPLMYTRQPQQSE